jgi:hypothetical protein
MVNNVNLGLSASDIVNVAVSLTPSAAQQRNFGALIILGDSAVIDTFTRYRSYSSLAAVAGDFSNTAPEFLAASLAFGQNPQLSQLYVGAWARVATHGTLVGAPLTAAQQAITNWNTVTSGGIDFTINGVPFNLTGLNFSSATTMTQVAQVIQTALSSNGTISWNSTYGYFQVSSPTSGPSSAVAFATLGAGFDISVQTGLSASVSGSYVAAGIAAESPLSCVTTLAGLTSNWYGAMFAASVMPADSDYVACAGFINGASPSRIFGVTTQEAAALNSSLSTDIASQLQALGYNRSFVQYSSSSPYACAAIFGRAFTVNFNGSNTLYTLKFDAEAGVVAEQLTETQAAALNQKNCNVFVNYNISSGTGASIAILQQGTMASGTFFDVIHGTDWLQNAIQTAVFNLLFTNTTKIPQTDAGVALLVNTVTQQLQQAVANGLVAPGVWNGPSVGAIVTGQTLSTGYYVFAPPVATQSQAARAARQSPVIQACIKLAGAIHFVSVVLSVNP